MQFDAVEAGLAGAHRRVGKQAGKRFRQIANVRVLHIGDALTKTELQRFAFIRRKNVGKFVVAHGAEPDADFRIGRAGQRRPMPIGDDEKSLEELLRVGPAANGEEIDELDQKAACGRRWRGAPFRSGG